LLCSENILFVYIFLSAFFDISKISSFVSSFVCTPMAKEKGISFFDFFSIFSFILSAMVKT